MRAQAVGLVVVMTGFALAVMGAEPVIGTW